MHDIIGLNAIGSAWLQFACCHVGTPSVVSQLHPWCSCQATSALFSLQHPSTDIKWLACGCPCLFSARLPAQDWPHKWQSFIPDLVAASRTNETLCENSMIILKLLSEEIFDFSQGELTQVSSAALLCAQVRSRPAVSDCAVWVFARCQAHVVSPAP